MQRLWTPWRMEYLVNDKPDGCIFCSKPAQGQDRENLILWRGRKGFIILNLYPYSNGHLMVAPYEHLPSLEHLDQETSLEMMSLVQRSLGVLRRALNPQGFNVGLNIGKAAGAGVVDHVHIHVVPRWVGDTNFMPVLAQTRMIPELLSQTYDRLRATIEGEQ